MKQKNRFNRGPWTVDRGLTLYLASRSPRRRKLVCELDYPIRVVSSTYQEHTPRSARPSVIVMRHAIGKARHATLPHRAHGIVLGADTILWFQGRVIGKPLTVRAARRLLRHLSGQSHWVYTGICLMDARTARWRAAYEKTQVTFKPLTDETIKRLLARSSPLDKAGGYSLQADRGELIARLRGSRTNVIGLPMELVRCELHAAQRRWGRAKAASGQTRNDCC